MRRSNLRTLWKPSSPSFTTLRMLDLCSCGLRFGCHAIYLKNSPLSVKEFLNDPPWGPSEVPENKGATRKDVGKKPVKLLEKPIMIKTFGCLRQPLRFRVQWANGVGLSASGVFSASFTACATHLSIRATRAGLLLQPSLSAAQDLGTQIYYWDAYKFECRLKKVPRGRFVNPAVAEYLSGK